MSNVTNSTLLRAIARALGTTSLVGGMAAAPASALAVCTPLSGDGGGTTINTPSNIGAVCDPSAIVASPPDLPRYWEFSWEGANNVVDISSSVQTGTPSFLSTPAFLSSGSFIGFVGSFYGNLNLYTAVGHSLIAGDKYETTSVADSVSGTTHAFLDDVLLAPGTDYILAIEGGSPPSCGSPPLSDRGTPAACPPINITVDFAGQQVAAVPEPGSLSLLGSALSLLAVFGWRRKRQS